jgi:TIR domain/SIR2-like domain
MLPLEQNDWRILLKSIRQRKCILLLGPGAAVDPADAESGPLSNQLAKRLAKELKEAHKGDDILATGDLAYVAQTYKHEMRQRHAGLELAIEDFYAPYRGQTTQLHRDLAALPFTLCISTTPEKFLLNAFQNAPSKKPVYDFYHFQPDPKRPRPAAMPAPPMTEPESHPLIYDLYGSLDETDSLVVAEDDLLDFLVGVLGQAPPLHPYVASQFKDPTVSFLFLGFGFRHWYVRVLLHALKANGHRSPSLALEEEAFFKGPEHQQTAFFFLSGHTIEFRLFPRDFASELRCRFEQETAKIQRENAITAQLPASAPTAFLCHENRDKSATDALSVELRKRGIRTWLDQQNLRGGDRWPELIPHVIEKQTDYVIVVQSPRMLDKPESYFKAEIHYALERQLKFGDLRFTIPILLERHSELPLPNLAHLHFVDMTLSDAPDLLAKTIHEDWEKRQSMKG